MVTFNLKYRASTPRESREGRRSPQRPGLLFCMSACLLVAVPLPAFADAGPGDNIAIALSSSIAADPSGLGGPSAIVPGTIVDFSVVVTGPTERGTPTTSFAISDKIPDHLSLYVGDLGRAGTGPAIFSDNDSGLAFSFGGLSSQNDSIEFSSDGGKTYAYVPVADSNGFDANVTHIRFRPQGNLLATTGPHERFSLRYRMKVK